MAVNGNLEKRGHTNATTYKYITDKKSAVTPAPAMPPAPIPFGLSSSSTSIENPPIPEFDKSNHEVKKNFDELMDMVQGSE